MSVKEYIQDTYAEVGRIHWPSRKKATLLTVLVIGISILVAIYLGVLDVIVAEGFKTLINRSL